MVIPTKKKIKFTKDTLLRHVEFIYYIGKQIAIKKID